MSRWEYRHLHRRIRQRFGASLREDSRHRIGQLTADVVAPAGANAGRSVPREELPTMRLSLIILALAFAVAGCSRDDGRPAAAPTSTVASTTTSTTAPAAPGRKRVGRPFELEQTGPNGPTTLEITILRPVTCGIGGFDLPSSDVSGDPARNVTAPKGMGFCRVDVTIKNVGKRTTQVSPSGFMYDTKDRRFPADDELAAAVSEREGGKVPGVNTVELPPTRSGTTLMIFAIPVGAEPAAVSIEEGQGETPLIAIGPADMD
jgi:hypothetical protein